MMHVILFDGRSRYELLHQVLVEEGTLLAVNMEGFVLWLILQLHLINFISHVIVLGFLSLLLGTFQVLYN